MWRQFVKTAMLQAGAGLGCDDDDE